MRCAIWYHLYNLKNLKNTYGGVLILVKLQASACTFTKINTPPWVFFMFFKYKCYQIAQLTTIFLLLYSLWNLNLTCGSYSSFEPHSLKQTLRPRRRILLKLYCRVRTIDAFATNIAMTENTNSPFL